ncbi:MAG: GTPase HflX [Phycisphaerae bacterium]|nr:GTPase HflX [Phycisphaerae bacterium]
MENDLTRQKTETALMVHIQLPDNTLPPKESIAELESLIKAANVEPLAYIKQKRQKIDPALYIGKGKVEEIADIALRLEADAVIFDNDLSPAQIRELEKIIERKVLDRSELILDIFAARANSAEARMQVELAQLEYTYPRLTRMWSHLDTVTGSAASGGVGTRGTGESQLEIDRRLVSKRVTQLTRQIKEIDQRKTRQVKSRSNHFTVSLVGYTNAGKSTLMNTVAGTATYAADQLFATLDTKTSRWDLSKDNYVLLSDTVGFVRDLPHHLVASFRATLEEAIHADLLLHVVDASHSHMTQQVDAVNNVLEELGCADKDILLVVNKVDCEEAENRAAGFKALNPDAILISAKTGFGIDELVDIVLNRVTGRQRRLMIRYGYDNGKVSAFIRAHGTIVNEEYKDDYVEMEAFLGAKQIHGLESLKPLSVEKI